MQRRVVSFAWGRGLGHVSRLIAVHRALGDFGWDSLFLVQRKQRMISDYELTQVVIPTHEYSLVGEFLPEVEGIGHPTAPMIARLIVDSILSADDVVLHDLVINREIYEQATFLGCPQMLIHRFHKNRTEPGAWVGRHAPNITHIFLLGRPSDQREQEGIILKGVHDIMRHTLTERSIWPKDMIAPRIVVTAGGGGHADAKDFLTSALEGTALYARQHDLSLSVYVITGPNFQGAFSFPLRMPGEFRVTPYVGPRYCIYRDTTALVTPGGYNTVQELAYTGTPAVVILGVRDFDEQRQHLEAAADRINVRIVAATPEDVAQGLTEILRQSTKRPQRATPPQGAQEIAEIIDVFNRSRLKMKRTV